ncbi:TlpA disulfide reductase family protein [Pedobacter gandavensis]|uniref:TlpA family protein disulfide reductase n=1 Tax=Pedobacter gandavensis TaxID=2679963 RepID=UPI0029308B17|nr:TlpA disulfide reductase family protein [Pedobacter gandavensis]
MNMLKAIVGILVILYISSTSTFPKTFIITSTTTEIDDDNNLDSSKVRDGKLMLDGKTEEKNSHMTYRIAIFNQVNEKLASMKTVKYHYLREFNYPSAGYINKTEGEMYIDFAKENDLTGMRFQYKDAQGFIIFNNSQLFNGNKKEQTISVSNIKAQKDLEGKSPLYNSLVTLRNALPLIIKDENIQKSITDTLINNKRYHVLQFFLQNKLLTYLGSDFSKVTKDLTFRYQIIVDKSTLLPLTILQTNANSQDLNRTDFKEIDTSPAPVEEISWFYTSYLNNYTIETPKIPVVLIKAGEVAPDWELTNFATDVKETLAQHKGKIILLEFWIKNCGYCIEAVPKLNALNDYYGKNNFKIVAINTEDNRYNVGVFTDKHPMNYSVVYGDDPSINKKYGVAGFPTVVLIAKNGRVLYSGSLDIETLKQLINKNL